jgi:hypothetical protein
MNISMVIADETKWVSYGATRVLKIWGYNNNATDDRYIQLHTKPAATIAAGDVPAVKSLWCGANAPFYWEVNADLSELSIAISSTEVNYTAITNTGLDLTAQVESQCLIETGHTLTGDLTTSVAEKQVWASASGPKRLLRLDVKNNSGAVAYPFIRASDTALAADTTSDALAGIANGATKTYFFGVVGLTPYQKDASGTAHNGCTVGWKSVATYAAALQAGTSVNIMAVYA